MKKWFGYIMLLLFGLGILAIIVVFVIGILRPTSIAPWWGTNEVVNKLSSAFIAPPKTIWDLVDLLLVPLVIAVGGILLNQAQQARNIKFLRVSK